MPVHLDFWLREPSRAGLPAPAQQELLQRIAWTIDCRTKYFPDSPLAFAERMKELLFSTFLPQRGPIVIEDAPNMASEVLSRSRAWEVAYLELPMLDADRRPLHDLHTMLVDVICMMARNDFPLAAPPRWPAELFEMRIAWFLSRCRPVNGP